MAIALTQGPFSLGSSKTAGTTLAGGLGQTWPVGTLVVVVWAGDNASASTPTATVSDTKGNTWTTVQQQVNQTSTTAAAGLAAGVCASLLTTQLTSSDTITLTFSTSIAVRVAAFAGFSGASATVRDKATSSTTVATSSTWTPTAVAGDLLIGYCANEDNTGGAMDTSTTNGTWITPAPTITTSGGSASTNMSIQFQMKVATGNGATPYVATMSGGGDNLSGYILFQPAPGPLDPPTMKIPRLVPLHRSAVR